MQPPDESKQEETTDDFVTVMTVTYPVELAVLKGRLDAEGIEYRVLNELTSEIYPFISNAIGGVQLQVRQRDFQTTIEILKDGDYLNEEDTQPSKILSEFHRITSRLPFIKKLQPELRLILALAVPVLLITGIIYFISQPSTLERLTKQDWCLDKVTYLEKDYFVKTYGLKFIWLGGCEEAINIRDDGEIFLPGFNSREARGWWILDGSSLQITHADTFDFVYNGIYEIDFTGEGLILRSEKTTLYCHSQHTGLW